MLAVWEGKTRFIPYGSSLCGLQWNKRRPKFILIVKKELEESSWVVSKHINYEYNIARACALTQEGYLQGPILI